MGTPEGEPSPCTSGFICGQPVSLLAQREANGGLVVYPSDLPCVGLR